MTATVTYGAGLVWFVGAYSLGFVVLCAWALCRAAKLGDEQERTRSWEIDDEDLAWHDWPWEQAS